MKIVILNLPLHTNYGGIKRMSRKDLEAECYSLEEFKARLLELINRHFHNRWRSILSRESIIRLSNFMKKHCQTRCFGRITVTRKIQRLYEALEALDYAYIYPLARLKSDWIKKGYREYICEDFHFAYQIYILDDGERIVRIHDAVHSLLYFWDNVCDKHTKPFV